MDPGRARRDLDAWRADFPADPYLTDHELRAVNRSYLGGARLNELDRAASEFARRVVETIGPAAMRYEQHEHLPDIERYDGVGNRVEEVHFDGVYHEAGAVVWESGVVASSGTPGRAFEQATLLYLLSLEGEAGHVCPAACTIGLARALRRRASQDVRERFLPPLLVTDYDRADRASQFLTEVQGGSDVGANTCRADLRADGLYSISGEKWFCSVADAEQFLVTARLRDGPEGTPGPGCFVVPRTLDGAPNGFSIRRLKDKLGTRGMASAELDFEGAVAWPVGPVEEGFKTAVGVVLNTSRWITAVGSTGMMRRALLEAAAYARHRRAFGRQVIEYPLIRGALAHMHIAWLGALRLTWLTTDLEDRIDAGTASEEDALFHRFMVNATKYVTSARASRVVRDGMEVLGGNGTIEDFSVLPRLYRDAVVYESWEGTHNVLAAQILRDLRKMPMIEVVRSRTTEMLEASDGEIVTVAGTLLDRTLAEVEHAVRDTSFGAMHFRRVLDRLVYVIEVGTLRRNATERSAAAADLLFRLRLDESYRPEADPDFARRVDALLPAADRDR